ncbi:MAG: MBL fold metallo-hydrolase [Agathobaculum sp.]
MKIMQLCVGVVGTNCYIVYDENTREAAVIDPGDNAPSILKAVEQEKLSVKYVLLTHAHFDHILAAHEVLEATGAQYVVPEGDLWLLDRGNMGQFRSLARSYVQDTPDIVAKEGTEVTFGGITATYMNTPGHTPGSSVIKMGDCLFTGDTLFAMSAAAATLKAAISARCSSR